MSWLPEWLSRAVTPESYGETVVNQIYGSPATTLQPDPAYDVADLSSPNVYVQGKQAVSAALGKVGDGLNRYLMYGVVVLLVAVAIYAVVPALVRR